MRPAMNPAENEYLGILFFQKNILRAHIKILFMNVKAEAKSPNLIPSVDLQFSHKISRNPLFLLERISIKVFPIVDTKYPLNKLGQTARHPNKKQLSQCLHRIYLQIMKLQIESSSLNDLAKYIFLRWPRSFTIWKPSLSESSDLFDSVLLSEFGYQQSCNDTQDREFDTFCLNSRNYFIFFSA